MAIPHLGMLVPNAEHPEPRAFPIWQLTRVEYGFDRNLPSCQVLKVISHREALALNGSEEVLHDWISVVAKGDFDWAFESVDVSVVAGALIRLMLPHQRYELLGRPALHLKIVVVTR